MEFFIIIYFMYSFICNIYNMSSVYCIATMIKLKIVLNDTFMYDKKVT